MAKSFLTYEQQINKLKNEKDLQIENEAFAQDILSKLSYYSLISGYKTLFKHAPSGKFRHDVTLEELAAFYYFDEDLRHLFLKYILHVERNIKSLISYYFCEKHGESQSEYLNANNYTLTKKNSKDVFRLVNSLQKSISMPSHYEYISHYATCYSNVPLWVAMNALTFGQASKMYQYIPNDIQAKISSNFTHVTERELHQFIRILASCRNVCAHGERLFSFHKNETIADTVLHKKLNILIKNNQYSQGKTDLFAVVIALDYLLDKAEFHKFKQSLSVLIKNVLHKCPHLSEDDLLVAMGFPKNWNQITRYKK